MTDLSKKMIIVKLIVWPIDRAAMLGLISFVFFIPLGLTNDPAIFSTPFLKTWIVILALSGAWVGASILIGREEFE